MLCIDPRADASIRPYKPMAKDVGANIVRPWNPALPPNPTGEHCSPPTRYQIVYTFTPAASNSTNCLATRGLRPPARRANACPLMNSWSLGICTPYCLASSSKMAS